jgi:hypothetical protein
VDERLTEDRELTEAYARLGAALAPPPEVASRVERVVVGRRRRRRATAIGAALMVTAGVAGGVVVLRSGDDGQSVVATDPGGPRGSFTLTRADGSTIELDDLTLSCEKGPGGGAGQAGHIYLFSPFELDPSRESLKEPYVYFDAVVAEVDGRDFTLPFDSESGSSDDRAMVLFAADAGGKNANEVSSAEPGASGTVRVLRASCEPTPVLELEGDGTLGSEVQQRPWTVVGSYR